MSADANQEQTSTDLPAQDAPAPSPATQGNDTPAPAPEPAKESTPQGQGASQIPPDHVPRYRLNEEIAKRRQLEDLLRTNSTPQQQAPKPQAAPNSAPPKQEDFATYEEYLDARADWRADQRYEAKERERLQQSQQQQEQAWTYNAERNWAQKAQDATVKYPDFEQKVYTAPALNPIAERVMKNSPVAGDLAYHLASNHDLIAKLNSLHPLDIAAEMGRIEGKLGGSSGQPPRKPSAGIPDITPVKPGTKQGPVDPYALETSVEDYVAATRPPPRRR